VTALEGAAAVVERAAELFGDDLIAVVAYGSWARGEAVASSDVDVLVVVESSAPITRALYRRWDARPLAWDAWPVEPHFVHLRPPEERATGEAPRIHDVSEVLLAERDRLPASIRPEVERLASVSRDLRRDRELAFDGAEDPTPSSFYAEADGVRARDGAALVVRLVKPCVIPDVDR
jgi:predicted nucleotidyltransferase